MQFRLKLYAMLPLRSNNDLLFFRCDTMLLTRLMQPFGKRKKTRPGDLV